MVFDSATRRTHLTVKYLRKAEESKGYYNQALSFIYAVGCHLPFEYLSFHYESICLATCLLKSVFLLYQGNKYTELHNIVKPVAGKSESDNTLLREEISARYQALSHGINIIMLACCASVAISVEASITVYFACRLGAAAFLLLCDMAENTYRTGSYTHNQTLQQTCSL